MWKISNFFSFFFPSLRHPRADVSNIFTPALTSDLIVTRRATLCTQVETVTVTQTVRTASPVAGTTAGTSGMEPRLILTAVSDLYYSDIRI